MMVRLAGQHQIGERINDCPLGGFPFFVPVDHAPEGTKEILAYTWSNVIRLGVSSRHRVAG